MAESDVTDGGSRVWVGRLLTAGLFVAVGLVAFLVYQGSVHNEFVWDDPIVLGQQLQAFHSVSDVFFPPPRIPQFGGLYYRPMILVSYMMDRALLGDTPFAFHLPVIIMHMLNTGLVFLLGRRLFGVRPGSGGASALGGDIGSGAILAALGAALLFATHPIHTESVCWMAGRSDNLAALFILPSFLSYLRWKQDRGRWGWLALSAALFLGGCLSKETAAGFLLIVVAADLLGIGEPAAEAQGQRQRSRGGAPGAPAAGPGKSTVSRKGDKDDRKGGKGKASREAPPAPWTIPFAGWAALGAAFVAYWGLRQKALTAYPETLRASSPDPITQVANVVEAIGFYIGKIFVPVHLDAYIPNIPAPGLCLAIGAVTIVVVCTVLWLARRSGERMLAFLILFFFGGLAPSLAIAFFQISEAPGRREIGDGEINFPYIFRLLDRLGYSGWVGLEYTPSVPTDDSLEWLRASGFWER
jgi:hypothetical protein